MHYVYLIQSVAHQDQRYVGSTKDLKARLKDHNEGRSPHTAKYKPWKLITYLAFSDKEKASEFERYLKSGSGHAFATIRLASLAHGGQFDSLRLLMAGNSTRFARSWQAKRLW